MNDPVMNGELTSVNPVFFLLTAGFGPELKVLIGGWAWHCGTQDLTSYNMTHCTYSATPQVL